MRTSDKDLQQAQDAPVADVQPTKQASPRKRAQRFPILFRDLRNLPLTDDERYYRVSLLGRCKYRYSGDEYRLEFSEIYKTRHPLLAVGLSLSDLGTRYLSSNVDVDTIKVRPIDVNN